MLLSSFVLLSLALTDGVAPEPAHRSSAGVIADQVETWTGLRFAVLESKIRRRIISTDTPFGLKVAAVGEDSAAARAGLRRGDLVMRVDGEPLRDLPELHTWLLQKHPGATFELEVSRLRPDAGLLSRHPWTTLDVTLELPSPDVEALTGIRFAVLESMIARNIVSTRTPYGLKVAEVREGSPAHAAGIRPGDVVMRWNGEPLLTTIQLRWFLIGVEGGDFAELEVMRRGEGGPLFSRDPWTPVDARLRFEDAGGARR